MLNGIVANMKEVKQIGADVLRKTAKPVPRGLFGTSELTSIISDMTETLDNEPDGVALAAPQIGLSWRLFIVRYDRIAAPKNTELINNPEIGVYINPKILKTSRKREDMEEGCLSVRNIYGQTIRYKRTTVEAQHENGTYFSRGGGGILAQIFQHEINHLDGILFVDHATHIYKIDTTDKRTTYGTTHTS